MTPAPIISGRASQWLYLQVLAAVVIGALLGQVAPDLAVRMQPFGEGFVKLVRMMIAPIIFITVVVGIGNLRDTASVGRIGLRALVYFEVMTTIAMLIGLLVGHVVAPGAGVHADPAALNAGAARQYVEAPHQNVASFLLAIIPDTVVGAFTHGDILPVLFFAVLFGIGVASRSSTSSTRPARLCSR
jgi:aerobic C4-dicarboxylate transport protein